MLRQCTLFNLQKPRQLQICSLPAAFWRAPPHWRNSSHAAAGRHLTAAASLPRVAETLEARTPARVGETADPGTAAGHANGAQSTAGQPDPPGSAQDVRGSRGGSHTAAKRPAEDTAPSSAPEPAAKKQKGASGAAALPPPTIVTRGAAFTPDVWQSGAVLLVDKPKDWTSFDVCGKLRGALKVKKVGHAGTLDPMATGLLIICTGRATKRIDSFVAMRKEYSGTLRLGQATPSYDAASDVCEEAPWEHVTDEDLERAKAAFVGDIQQKPPMFSAISVGGERLYKAARRGETVERAPRPVSVHSFELRRDAAGARDVHLRVACSKGTYLRSLAHDLGKAAGSAAHLIALRRERIGEHDVADAWQVADLVAAAQAARKHQG